MRFDDSADCDERTMFELYYPAMQAAIDANVGSMMCAYNKVNMTYSCDNYNI